MKQIRIAIASNTGGSGKTTLATHLGYLLGRAGLRVILIELDGNGSFDIFTGTDEIDSDDTENSIAKVLLEDFDGKYPLVPVWEDHTSNVQVIRGGPPLDAAVRGLHIHHLRPYEILKERLEDYPLDADVIIFDTPASLEPLGLLALAACTHVLVAIKPEPKDSKLSAKMITWFYRNVKKLRLKPHPEILGFVPSRIDLSMALHRNLLGLTKKGEVNEKIAVEKTLPHTLDQLGYLCFPAVHESGFFLSASNEGIPVQIHRPGDKVSKSFQSIAEKVIFLVQSNQGDS